MAETKGSKIYTRSGDAGKTSLIGGKRVPKDHLRVECYGTVDELNSVIGMLRDLKETQGYIKTLLKIQEHLFVIESLLAVANEKDAGKLPELKKKDVVFLEKSIDLINVGLPEVHYFVLPGGHPAVSWCHIARTVCRRAERVVTTLSREEKINSLLLQYLNRLSDYLFVLSKRLAFDLKIKEAYWKPAPVKK